MLSQEQELILSEYSGLYDIVVPQDNLLRRINALIDFSFVYQELVDKYCSGNGRMAESPIRMFKYLLLKVIYDISDVADAFRKNCDISIVVSADSDMIPAMELAMEESHPVFAYFPPFQRSSAIASMFTSVIRMERYESRFRNSLLPDTVTLKDGYELTIPEKWKAYQSL